MVRILHAADFHLDSAFTGLNEQQARQRRQESRDLTRRMVEYANDHGVQLMLLAGDLFDSGSIYGQTAEELAAALAEFRGHVVIAPGNHDCYTAASPYARTLWPDNVLVFTAPEMLSMGLSFPQYGCTVYGAAFTAPEMPESAELAGIAEQDGSVAIGILHGEVGVKDSRYRPIPLQQIAQSGLDYLALGHVHACSGVQLAGKTAYAYPGCPEGRGFDELGDKGFLAGEVDKGSVKLRFVPFAKRRYEIVTVFDNREDFARQENYPAAEQVIFGDYYHIEQKIHITPRDYVVIMTPGHQADREVLLQAMKTPACYVGCIGSRHKIAATNQYLMDNGVEEAELSRIHAPIGITIFAETPEEIAISIAAELIRCRAQLAGTEKARKG